MASLRITLLGGFEARLGSGEAIDLHGRKTQALLAYLALPPGEPRSRDKLVALLWSDRGEQQARGSLRQALAELRKALGDADPPPLVAGRDAVHLDAGAVEVDAVELERLVADGAPEALERAAELYQGDLLDGIGVHDPAFEDWLRTERERVHDSAREALSSLLDHQTTAGDTERAIATARRLLSLDPLQEAVHRALMRLYADKGERNLALRQYQACRDVLKVELGIEPDAETERLHEEIRRKYSAVREQPAAPAAREDTTDTTAGARESEALPLPSKPSIAVLPFVNMSGDPEQAYFSDGITDDIITELSRFRELFVIARNSSFTYKGRTVKVQEVARELGVQYVLEGSVRKAGNRVRVTAQLVDATTGHHLWGERYDRDLNDIFAVQDEVTQMIVSTLAGRLEDAGRARAEHKTTEKLSAYDCVLRGRQCLDRGTKEDILEARRMFGRALELDPGYAAAYAELAWTYFEEYGSSWSESPQEALDRGFDLGQRAVRLDDTDSRAHLALGYGYFCKMQHELAEVQIETAIALNPNDSENLCIKGWFLTLTGRSVEGIACGNEAIRLNPFVPGDCLYNIGVADYLAGRYEQAIATLGKISNPVISVHGCLAACYAQLGRDNEARAAMAEFHRLAKAELAIQPGEDVERWRAYWSRQFAFKDPADLEHLLEGLRKAGLPV